MPYRALAVTTRHHPIAIGCYAAVTILAALYLLDVATAASLTDETTHAWSIIWQASLLAGGVLALVGAWLPARWLLKGLVMEALGAMTLGIELGVYVAVMATSLNNTPWASVVVFGGVAAGCLLRSWTATRDRWRVIRATVSPTIVPTLAEAQK